MHNMTIILKMMTRVPFHNCSFFSLSLSVFYSRLLPVFRSVSQLQDVGLGVCAYAPTRSENYTTFCTNLNFAPAGPGVSI